jgi:hypothetical protein
VVPPVSTRGLRLYMEIPDDTLHFKPSGPPAEELTGVALAKSSRGRFLKAPHCLRRPRTLASQWMTSSRPTHRRSPVLSHEADIAKVQEWARSHQRLHHPAVRSAQDAARGQPEFLGSGIEDQTLNERHTVLAHQDKVRRA